MKFESSKDYVEGMVSIQKKIWWLSSAFLFSLISHHEVCAEALRLNAKVIWTQADRVYCVSSDSGAFEPAKNLTFVYRGREVARGKIVALYNRELALVQLQWGSLINIDHLDSVEVAEQPAPLPPLSRLRIGYPSQKRSNLIFSCSEMAFDHSSIPAAFRPDTLEDAGDQWVRDSLKNPKPDPWPDTLFVREVDEVSDEEIALERGELDIAVFWPGELSQHMRKDPRWQNPAFGRAQQGLVAALWLSQKIDEDDSNLCDLRRWYDFDLFNEELFRGDLVPVEQAAAWAAQSPAVQPHPPAPVVRFQVERSWPGQRLVERFLNRRSKSSPAVTTPGQMETVRLFYLDAPVSSFDSISQALASYLQGGDFPQAIRAQADTLLTLVKAAHDAPDSVRVSALDTVRHYMRSRLHVTFLFALRCPVISQPELRPYLELLRVDALVNLVHCQQSDRKQ